jgi:hypothetical protein
MTQKDIIKLERELLEHLPGLSLKGSLMFKLPIKPVLRGVVLEGSSFDRNSFTVTAFMQPMCVPAEHLHLNFSVRIRQPEGGDRWSTTRPDLVVELSGALKRQAVPFLSRAASLIDFVAAARTFSRTNPNTQRAIAYSLARAGRIDEGAEIIDQLLDRLDAKVPWQAALAHEATQLRTKMAANPTEALQQLETWELETVRKLGLSAVCKTGQSIAEPGSKRNRSLD